MTFNTLPDPYSKCPPAREIARGIYQVWMPLSGSPMTGLDHMNAYLVKGTHGWLLIDTGWNAPNTCQALEAALNLLKLRLTDIETVLLTHSHPDHSGMSGKIKNLSPQTQLLMHHWESLVQDFHFKESGKLAKTSIELLEKHGVPLEEENFVDGSSMPLQDFVTIAAPDKLLFGGEIIRTGIYNLEVIWTPGHSPGHVCLYEPENRFLFSGDHILPGITPNVGYNNLSGDNPLGDYLYTLGKLSSLTVKEVHPGHELSFTGFHERITAMVKHHEEREAEIAAVLREGIEQRL
jgi:glyoxylase-like metal-dependent hydrolase (beta-lactamase superfamily II)